MRAAIVRALGIALRRGRAVLVVSLAVIPAIVGGLAVVPSAAGAQGDPLATVRVGVSAQPDTVTVGDPIVIRVRVSAPPGAQIAFPDSPDSAAQVQAILSRALTTNRAAGQVDQTATYTVVAWDVGNVAAGLGDVVVTLGTATRHLPLASVAVHVRSVLPADTTLRVPKPARPPMDVAGPWWKRWWPLLLALAVIAILLWLWWRSRRRGTATGTAIDAHVFAEREFARIESLGLVDAGERGRHVALMVDVLRDYLALRLPEARASLTSSELAAALRATRAVPHARLAALLEEADLVKFARRPLTSDQARALGREARGIARDVETALTPVPADADSVRREAA
ncbi:MAG: hypothetical protein ACJ79K_02450 [Gemmatimonadaceae bacterium]